MTKKIHTRKISVLLFIFMITAAFTTPQLVQAHDYYKIKLEIHVVDPASMNDSSIKENVDTVNEIFAACRIKFNVINIDRTTEGHAINITGRTALRNLMKSSLTGPEFKGSGAGVTITDKVGEGDNTNGMTMEGDPTTPIVKDGTSGDTWAHELAHGMGLDHGGKDTDGDGENDSWDTDGDGNFDTPADTDNNLWPFRDERTGNKFSESQCEKLIETAKKIGQGVLNAEQTAEADGDSFLDKIYDYVVDVIKESPVGKIADLISGSVSSLQPFTNLTIQWVVNGIFPIDEPVDLTFAMGVDTDNNEITGLTMGGRLGIDFVIEVVMLDGNFFTSNKYISSINHLNFTESDPDIGGILKTSYMNESTSFESYQQINNSAVFSNIELTINTTDLGVIDAVVPAVFQVTDWQRGTDDYANFTLHTRPIDTARIHVDQMKIWEGYNLNIEGENFTANAPVTLNFNDEDIKTVMSNSSGGFSSSITIPVTALGSYYMEAIDEDGNLAIMILDIIDNPNPTTTSTTSSTTTTSTVESSSISTSHETDSSINFPIIGLLTGFVTLFVFARRLKKITNY